MSRPRRSAAGFRIPPGRPESPVGALRTATRSSTGAMAYRPHRPGRGVMLPVGTPGQASLISRIRMFSPISPIRTVSRTADP